MKKYYPFTLRKHKNVNVVGQEGVLATLYLEIIIYLDLSLFWWKLKPDSFYLRWGLFQNSSDCSFYTCAFTIIHTYNSFKHYLTLTCLCCGVFTHYKRECLSSFTFMFVVWLLFVIWNTILSKVGVTFDLGSSLVVNDPAAEREVTSVVTSRISMCSFIYF